MNEQPPTCVPPTKRGPDAEVLGDVGRHVAAGGEHGVDVALLQAGVGERVVRRLHVQLEGGVVGQLAEFVGLGDADDGRDAAQGARIGAHAVARGWNLGSVISSVMSSNTTSSGMSQRSAAGSAATPTMCDIRRGPSSSSTMPMTIGAGTG